MFMPPKFYSERGSLTKDQRIFYTKRKKGWRIDVNESSSHKEKDYKILERRGALYKRKLKFFKRTKINKLYASRKEAIKAVEKAFKRSSNPPCNQLEIYNVYYISNIEYYIANIEKNVFNLNLYIFAKKVYFKRLADADKWKIYRDYSKSFSKNSELNEIYQEFLEEFKMIKFDKRSDAVHAFLYWIQSSSLKLSQQT